MGRIGTKLVKRTAKELIVRGKGIFNTNFESNKKFAVELANIPSKKLRNVIAGYVTRLNNKKALK